MNLTKAATLCRQNKFGENIMHQFNLKRFSIFLAFCLVLEPLCLSGKAAFALDAANQKRNKWEEVIFDYEELERKEGKAKSERMPLTTRLPCLVV